MNGINANLAVSQKLLQILTKASIENLNAGDILKGRVQSLENGMLLLKLLDGASFTAKVPDGYTTSPGELVTLEIGEKINDQLTARIVPSENRPLPDNTTAQPLKDAILQKLVSLGASQPEKLVSEVMSLLKAKPDMPVDQAAFITANRLDSTPEMLNVIRKISEQEFRLNDNLQSLKGGLANILSQEEATVRQAVLKPVLVSQAADELSTYLEHALSEASASEKESIIQNIREILNKTLLEETSDTNPEAGKSQVLEQHKGYDSVLAGIRDSLINKMKMNDGDDFGIQVFKPEAMDKLLDTIRKVLEDVHTRSDSLGGAGEKELEELLDKLFDKAVLKFAHGIAEDTDIRDKAKALKEIMDFSHKVLSQADGNAPEMNLPAFKEIDNAFRFFNQVTTYDAMIQIPLRINKENTTGELYVMKRRNGRKKLDVENFTLYLSLQTSALGRVESFLNSSCKYVTISFRVEDEALVRLVKDNHRVLYDNLLKKGYKLAELKCRTLENDPANLFDAAAKAKELLGLHASLDIKL